MAFFAKYLVESDLAINIGETVAHITQTARKLVHDFYSRLVELT